MSVWRSGFDQLSASHPVRRWGGVYQKVKGYSSRDVAQSTYASFSLTPMI